MFKVEAITPSIGAEISGVSLNKDLNSATVEKIYSALIKHQVIFFRDQDISHEQHKQIAHFFGPLQTHPAYGTVPDFPK